MGLWNWLFGLVRVRISSADVMGCLSQLGQQGVTVFNWDITDELNAEFTIKRSEYKKTARILSAKVDEILIIDKKGMMWTFLKFSRRPILSLGVLILLLLNMYLPGRILFVFVEGNTNVPTQKIVEEAQKLGLKFWSNRRDIRSENIKNGLLEAIPQLQWSGVNTNGCVATISIREKKLISEKKPQKVVSSIVASRDGVILTCTATKGNPVCKPGQAVKAGEVLISGYRDCGIQIQATRAEGEVYAKTQREITVIYPSVWQEKTCIEEQTKKYSLIIGKKRINLYNDSGISYPTCGKIYQKIEISLPGGFCLPISIAVEKWETCDFLDRQMESGDLNELVSKRSCDYLNAQMIAGTILTSNEVVTESDSAYQIDGKYSCIEMIGQVRKEGVYGDNR